MNIKTLNLGKIKLVATKHASERARERGIRVIPGSLTDTLGKITTVDMARGQIIRILLLIDGVTYVAKPAREPATWVVVTVWHPVFG